MRLAGVIQPTRRSFVQFAAFRTRYVSDSAAQISVRPVVNQQDERKDRKEKKDDGEQTKGTFWKSAVFARGLAAGSLGALVSAAAQIYLYEKQMKLLW